MDHATPSDVSGRDVCGVLPHSLSALTDSFMEIPLDLPRELWGKEVTLEEVRRYAGEHATYKVMTFAVFEKGCELAAEATFNDGCQCAPYINWQEVRA